MARVVHYPVSEDHPTTNKDSRFRAAICRPTTATFLDVEHKKKHNGDKGQMYKWGIMNTRLGWDYRTEAQSYFTRNEEDVTCKKCKTILENKNNRENVLQIKVTIENKKRKIRTLQREIEELNRKAAL